MRLNRIGLLIYVFCVMMTSIGWGRALVSQSLEQAGIADEPTTRTVKVIAPSIACFSRFEDGLKSRIRDRIDWVHSVKIKALHKKIVMPRPEFDFGDDVEIEFEIDKDRPVSELAKAMIKQGFSGDSVLTSGHKMSDFKNVPLKKLISKNVN